MDERTMYIELYIDYSLLMKRSFYLYDRWLKLAIQKIYIKNFYVKLNSVRMPPKPMELDLDD